MNINNFLRYILALLLFAFMGLCFYLKYLELGPKKKKIRIFTPPSYIKSHRIVHKKDNKLGIKVGKFFIAIATYPKNALVIKKGDLVKVTGYIDKNWQLHVFKIKYANLWPRRIKIGVSILALSYVFFYVLLSLEKKWSLSWKKL